MLNMSLPQIVGFQYDSHVSPGQQWGVESRVARFSLETSGDFGVEPRKERDVSRVQCHRVH